ncbi:hypothetical protein FGO68_gene13075 [Halteria grandinella]|uniref:Uncharacterized protein n=1 Tax=Halteria grandinella TaxID=5974 RepID=A0A8J8NXV8_HALGN|nr:hypothetical protein FGO68_gene13075 [Halteria grandinella]
MMEIGELKYIDIKEIMIIELKKLDYELERCIIRVISYDQFIVHLPSLLALSTPPKFFRFDYPKSNSYLSFFFLIIWFLKIQFRVSDIDSLIIKRCLQLMKNAFISHSTLYYKAIKYYSQGVVFDTYNQIIIDQNKEGLLADATKQKPELLTT